MMKFLGSFLIAAVLCVSVTQSAPRPSNTWKFPTVFDGIKTGGSVKRAANGHSMAGVPFFEVHDLTGVEHDDIPDDVIPFEIVNIDGHTHETLPADIIPVEIVDPVENSDAEVFEVHNLDGVSDDDIPDDLAVFEVVDISGHTVDTLPDDVFPVHITPIGSVSAGASAFSADGSAVSASASASSSGALPAGVLMTRPAAGMSRVQVVPSYINRMMKFPAKSSAPSYVAPAVSSPGRPYVGGGHRKVKCRQPDLFPFRGPSTGMFKFFSDIVREELSDCSIGGQMI